MGTKSDSSFFLLLQKLTLLVQIGSKNENKKVIVYSNAVVYTITLIVSHEIHLKERPIGMPINENFELVMRPIVTIQYADNLQYNQY